MARTRRIMFFCLGNICRSPLAHGLFEAEVARRGDAASWLIDSSGTSHHHIGEAPDPGSQRVARLHDLDISHQRAQQLTARHIEEFDWLVAMSRSNQRDALRLVEREEDREKILLLRDFDDEANGNLDVPDPWGHGEQAFLEVHRIIERCMAPLFVFLNAKDPSP